MRSRCISVTDMDPLSAYFFNLERKAAQQKQIACLRLPDGRMTSNVMELNWEDVWERVCAPLSRWKSLLPQLSYRGRAVVANNLLASTPWHKLGVLQPPAGLIQYIQRRLVTFIWSGQHWIRSSVLYLPVQEGGQGLVDIISRIMTFRLQTAQR